MSARSIVARMMTHGLGVMSDAEETELLDAFAAEVRAAALAERAMAIPWSQWTEDTPPGARILRDMQELAAVADPDHRARRTARTSGDLNAYAAEIRQGCSRRLYRIASEIDSLTDPTAHAHAEITRQCALIILAPSDPGDAATDATEPEMTRAAAWERAGAMLTPGTLDALRPACTCGEAVHQVGCDTARQE
jgi:hypothetical protein